MTAHRAPFGVYTFANVSLSLDGRLVTGVGEGDDAIVIEPTQELGKPMEGADGSSLVSISASRAATLTLKLLPTSPFNAYLRQKANRMRDGAISGVTFPVGFSCMSLGVAGGAVDAVVIKEPDTSRGASVKENEWKIFLPVWEPGEITVRRT